MMLPYALGFVSGAIFTVGFAVVAAWLGNKLDKDKGGGYVG